MRHHEYGAFRRDMEQIARCEMSAIQWPHRQSYQRLRQMGSRCDGPCAGWDLVTNTIVCSEFPMTMGAAIVLTKDSTVAVGFNRMKRDFTDDDLAVLDVLRSHRVRATAMPGASQSCQSNSPPSITPSKKWIVMCNCWPGGRSR